jgi:hypothetical protein
MAARKWRAQNFYSALVRRFTQRASLAPLLEML